MSTETRMASEDQNAGDAAGVEAEASGSGSESGSESPKRGGGGDGGSSVCKEEDVSPGGGGVTAATRDSKLTRHSDSDGGFADPAPRPGHVPGSHSVVSGALASPTPSRHTHTPSVVEQSGSGGDSSSNHGSADNQSRPGYALGAGSMVPGSPGSSPMEHPGSSYVPMSTSPNSGAMIPPPPAAQVPVVHPPYQFVTPRKRITSKPDISKFIACPTGGALYLGFVVALSESVKGIKISDECHVSPVVQNLIGVLQTMSGWIDEIPPVKQPARYGNIAYRDWQKRLQERGPAMVASVLPDQSLALGAIREIFPYFADSFGNAIRIDYGTGHEANFGAFLLCFARLGLVSASDYPALVTRLFVVYLSLMRKLQTTYWLEPAGSHGVWGLDDYCFLPFIFGAAQLIGHKYMRPKSIHNEDILRQFSEDYFYLAAVKFVKQVKKGMLQEHSPMLNDISGVPTWHKVHIGMLKMYRAEVLEKVPIMQHFLFGSLITWPEDK
ncbi:hypothetical protein CBR_g45439 [Chara braunii]|uniref:Serine/threonine-protein phosphatase 2A activator n=1 Tax=Chara braunii TaxID=69332 RepID=A0A388LYS0_CHABU|nr:hypothetical protein CBR_g45439 [Chara braunii]|eukprot:GBG87382.1 hypothetical protein CBR_g45439 [Chara braunii]